jgi:hydrogenase nickel incorporation protein HypB
VHKVTDISMEIDVLDENRRLAEENLEILRSHGIASLDVLGSIGAGKTELIISISRILKERGLRPAAIAGDVTGKDDYERLTGYGIPAVNLNTGKECHLDSHLVKHGLEKLDLDSIDFLFIENVGNLVCPADFPVGTDKRLVLVSVTEGDDMIRKHPFIFLNSDIAALNKVDLLPHLDVDADRLENDLRSLKHDQHLHRISTKTGEGMDELMEELMVLLP